MIELKFLVPPFAALAVFSEQFLSGLPNGIRLAIDLAAVCTLAAGFLILGRLRGALVASEASANAWKQERDAAVVRADRYQKEKEEDTLKFLAEISDLRVEVTKLQERPTLEVLAAKLDVINDQLSRGREEAATRIIEAIERMKDE